LSTIAVNMSFGGEFFVPEMRVAQWWVRLFFLSWYLLDDKFISPKAIAGF
jgi:hypothetical protein